MVWWRYVEVWTVAQGPNSKARRLTCSPHGHRVTVALPCVLGSLGMSSRFGTPQVDAWKKITIEESHEETEQCPNMN